MWQHVAKGFEILLSGKIYPTLFECPDYCELLRLSGMARPFPRDIASVPANQRNSLAENAKLRANLLMLELQQLAALRQTKARGLELKAPEYRHLYRLWNSKVKTSELRFFWFTEDLLRQSHRQAGAKKSDRLEWLRHQMAVAYNWSLCDRIAKLHLGPGDEILAVEAEGLPMRGVTIRPGDREVRLPTDYWKNFDKYAKPLPGGAPQLFLYLVPPTHVSPYW
jgi:hypothetical protein